MAENISDKNGRALEYCIVDSIITRVPHVKVLLNTSQDQIRDGLKFKDIPTDLQQRFIDGSEKILKWLEDKFTISQAKSISLERLQDNASKKGDVTDIRLVIDSKTINLSIKHNHIALKHQRPGATPQQIGFLRKTIADTEFRNDYRNICNAFQSKAALLSPSATLFSELKDIQSDFIDDNLYEPMCMLVSNYLNKYASSNPNAQQFFKFIVGTINFYKIVVNSKSIEISEYAELTPVKGLTSEIKNKSYVIVTFSNGWVISMRLHTASSKIKGTSLKFDTQPVTTPVPTEKV
jgi:hypothetical protein